jgi:hypothetical protein
MYAHGARVGAHRYAYMLLRGPIPDGRVLVCHQCDNRLCVNPGHLYLGDDADNAHDRETRGRHHIVEQNGERNPSAILTDEAAAEIRSTYVGGTRWEPGNGKALAERFGVAISTVRAVAAGRRRSVQS